MATFILLQHSHGRRGEDPQPESRPDQGINAELQTDGRACYEPVVVLDPMTS